MDIIGALSYFPSSLPQYLVVYTHLFHTHQKCQPQAHNIAELGPDNLDYVITSIIGELSQLPTSHHITLVYTSIEYNRSQNRMIGRYMEIAIDVVRWSLILISVVANLTLAWKIITRKYLHSIFNLSLTFFFICCGFGSPFLIYEHGNLLEEIISFPDMISSTTCHRLLLVKMILLQVIKVFIVNFLFR